MNGWIEKYKANADRLKDDELARMADDMEASGCEADPDQWDQLNAAVDALPPETASETERSEYISGAARGDNRGPKVPGADGHDAEHFVSGDEPGTGSNPIGYPGTDQDQDAPGQAKKTVPGQKPVEKPGKK